LHSEVVGSQYAYPILHSAQDVPVALFLVSG